jgi:hypothetical protein
MALLQDEARLRGLPLRKKVTNDERQMAIVLRSFAIRRSVVSLARDLSGAMLQH